MLGGLTVALDRPLRRDHAEIAWDDDSKDYSDLPPAVMQVRLCPAFLEDSGGSIHTALGSRALSACVPGRRLCSITSCRNISRTRHAMMRYR